MNPLFLAAIVFFAIFTQSVSGFGLALVSMPFLVKSVGVQVAAPLIALVALTAQTVLLLRYRSAINLRVVIQLSIASLVGVPLGVWILKFADEHFVLGLLGIVVSGYALYALFNLRLPEIKHPRWAYGFGFFSGVLSGAYNVGGPPVIIYGSCRRWSPAEFKSNLQGLFQFNTIVVIATHFLAHNYTPVVWESYLIALPGIALGLLLGLSLDRFINPVVFRKIVLALLVVLGLNLILG